MLWRMHLLIVRLTKYLKTVQYMPAYKNLEAKQAIELLPVFIN